MAIEAIVANMDPVWNARSANTNAALKRFLQNARDDGYPLLLVSDLNAARLNAAITEQLGHEGISYFSSILASSETESRYAVALHTLATPADRVVAVSAEERGFEEARSSGITQCMALKDALQQEAALFGSTCSSDQ
jgi:hypothetical protein